MSPEQLTEILKKHPSTKARCAYLRSQLEMLNRFLRKFQGEMIEDQVSMSQAITGMPHGTTVGDPTSRLALDIASGKVTPFIKEIQEDISRTEGELQRIEPDVRAVEIILEALNDRERAVFELKMFADYSWPDILDEMNKRYNNSYAKRSLQRLFDRAFDKACEIVQ